MKKYLSILFLLVLMVPSIALASWWNPLSWFNNWNFHKTEIVSQTEVEKQKTAEEKIIELQRQLDEIKNQKENSISATMPIQKENIKNAPFVDNSEIIKKQVQAQVDIAIKAKTEQDALIAQQKMSGISLVKTPSIVTAPELVNNIKRPLKSDGSLSYIAFNDLNVRDYVKNPKASLNKPVKIINGYISSFNQGTQNYISVVDLNDFSSKINFRIEDDNDYTTLTNELVKYDKVLIYGYGESNVKFNVVGGNSGSYEEYQPVIEIDTLYKCSPSSLCLYNYSFGVSKIFENK